MKKIILLTLCCIAALTTYAQGDLKARMEFEQAETAFAQGDYQTALTHVNATEKLLKTYAPRISYLKIVTLDMLCDYTNLPNPYFVQLQAEVKRYLDYADRNQASVVMDKFREVYDISGKMEREQQAQAAWAKIDPSDAEAVQLFMTQYPNSTIADGLNRDRQAVQAIANMGKADLDPQTYRTALNVLETSLARGNLSAAVTLGDMYRGGYGVESNYEKALEYYNTAVGSGDAEAIRKLADFYRTRLFDYDRAIELYKILAERGDTKAMNAIGRIYYKGMEYRKRYYKEYELELAQPWFEKAAALGDADALANLGLFKYDEGNFKTLTPAKSRAEAKEMYEKAIGMGSLDGLCYLAAYIVERKPGDIPEAQQLALKAAEAGHTGAMLVLSSTYMNKKGMQRMEWLAKAVQADTDIAEVYYLIGACYYGYDVIYGSTAQLEKNERKAIPWFRLALRMGSRSPKRVWYSADYILQKEKITDNPNETFDELRTPALKQLLEDIEMANSK